MLSVAGVVMAARPAVALAGDAVQLDAAYSPSAVVVGGAATLTLTLTSSAGPVSNVEFQVRPGYGVGLTPSTEPACGGTLTVSEDGFHTPPIDPGPAYLVGLSGGTVMPGQPCTIALTVTGAAAGIANWGTPASEVNVTFGQLGTLSVSPTAAAPSLQADVSPATTAAGSPSTLTIEIANPNSSSDLTAVGANVQAPPGVFTAVDSNTCGGIAQSVFIDSPSSPPGDVFGDYLGEGTLAPNGRCELVFPINTDDLPVGTLELPVTVTAAQSGPGESAIVPVTIAPAPAEIQPARATATLTPARVTLGRRSTLTVRLSNPNATTALAGISFSSTLPRGVLLVAHRTAPKTCGGRLTTSRDTRLRLAGGHLRAGAGCLVRVVLAAQRVGRFTLKTGPISTNSDGSSASAIARLIVTGG